MKIKTIGIIGFGYVGNAMHSLLEKSYDIKIFDTDDTKKTHSKEEVLDCDITFICVPTPMNQDGSQNLSNVYSALEGYNTKTLYVLKSTVLPGTTKHISQSHQQIKIVCNPEFLTESNWLYDVRNPSRVIIGGEDLNAYGLYYIYKRIFPASYIKFFLMGSEEAELVKYMSNGFLATKVSFVNEFKMLADSLNLEWDKIIEGFISDPRIGMSHTKVPGPDGKIGYAGSSFPKDVSSILSFATTMNQELSVLESGWFFNQKVRPEKDWEPLKERSVL